MKNKNETTNDNKKNLDPTIIFALSEIIAEDFKNSVKDTFKNLESTYEKYNENKIENLIKKYRKDERINLFYAMISGYLFITLKKLGYNTNVAKLINIKFKETIRENSFINALKIYKTL